jgi:photosystem II stability/assembly factor-like uncharacterized protein
MRDEDDLRSALHTLERHAPDPDIVLRPLRRRPGGYPPGGRRHTSTRWRRGGAWPQVIVSMAAAASVIAVVAAVLVTMTGPQRGRAGGSPPAAQAVTPFSSSFRYVGTGPQTDSLDCVTASVCYAWNSGNKQDVAERTSNGGATWRPVAALPDHLSLSQTVTPSCPTTEMCAAVAGRHALAVTTDGGARWRISPRLGASSDLSFDQVSCATAEKCVVHVENGGAGSFLATTNGGRTWSGAAVPAGAPSALWYLRCDTGGRCIGLAPTGTNTHGGLVALRSADNGRTWAVSSARAPASDIFMVSCGDGLHCIFVGGSGATMTTSDGGVTWQQRAAPRTWPNTATSVSCPARGTCFIALADATGVTGPGYERPMIEATHDGGRTWASLSLPTVDGSPLAIVYPLSCPSAEGCIGVAATPQQFSGSDSGQRAIISSLRT